MDTILWSQPLERWEMKSSVPRNLRTRCANGLPRIRSGFKSWRSGGTGCLISGSMMTFGVHRKKRNRDAAPKVRCYFWLPWSTTETAKEMKEILLNAKGEPLDADNRKLVEEKMLSLIAARVPCPAELLGSSSSPSDGLWRSVFIQGRTPRWEENARFFRPLVRNKVGQAYDASTGKVTNYGEILGSSVHFVAEGQFSAKDDGSQCPKEFDVEIEQGGLVVLGLPLLSSAISGPGLVRVLYIDEDLRIFESPTESPDRWEEEGLRVIQVRDQLYD